MRECVRDLLEHTLLHFKILPVIKLCKTVGLTASVPCLAQRYILSCWVDHLQPFSGSKSGAVLCTATLVRWMSNNTCKVNTLCSSERYAVQFWNLLSTTAWISQTDLFSHAKFKKFKIKRKNINAVKWKGKCAKGDNACKYHVFCDFKEYYPTVIKLQCLASQ